MRKFIACIALVVFLVFGAALWVRASWESYPNIQGTIWDAWSGDYGSGIKNTDSNLYFWTKSGGKFSLYETPTITNANRIFEASKSGLRLDVPMDFDAAVRATDFARPATIINSASQLSSWQGTQGAVNGVSWFQAEPGKAYEIDLAALAHSLTGYDCSGVTIIGPDATVANNQKPFTVTIIPPTGSVPASDVSGTTLVYVMPYPGSGATSYGANATPKPQSMQGDYQDANGVLTAGAVLSGTSASFLNKIGESAEFQTRNDSGVSLFAKNATVKK